MRRILIVEDEKDLADLLAFNLEKEGYLVTCAYDGFAGLSTAYKYLPDLILLDLMLPVMSGLEVSKSLRKDSRTSQTHIIMVTAKGDEIDRVVGFEVGADDYIVKPFSIRELTLRIKAVFRRLDNELPTTNILSFGDIIIDQERHVVLSDCKEVDLTSTEFKLLMYLAERSSRVVTRESLLQNVWGCDYSGDSRTVDTHITRLRSKLGMSGDQIRTVRGFGYKMEEGPSHSIEQG